MMDHRAELMSEEDVVALGVDEEELAEADVAAEFDLEGLHVQDIISITARLAEVLAKEADFLEDMKVGPIEGLQQEKLLLTHALDASHKHFKKHPEILDDANEEELDDLEEVIHIFEAIKAENHRRLTMARSVNQRVVQAITDVVNEKRSKSSYTKKGKNAQPEVGNVHVSLNEKV